MNPTETAQMVAAAILTLAITCGPVLILAAVILGIQALWGAWRRATPNQRTMVAVVVGIVVQLLIVWLH